MTNQSIGRSSAIIAAGTLVSRLLGFVKSVVLVWAIGQGGSQAAAAFGLANQLPNNVYALVAGGVMSAVLVPQIVRATRGADKGQAYVSKLLTLGGTVFLLVTLAATIAAPFIVNLYAIQSDSGRGFTSEQMALAIGLAYWCLPQILFYAIYTLLGEVFNARGQFGPFTWAPVLNNVVSIAGLAAFIVIFGERDANMAVSDWTDDKIMALGLITTLGVAVQALMLVVLFKRTGLVYRLDFGWRGVGLRATGKRALWLFGIVIIGQVKGLVQTRVVTLADPTGPNILSMQNAWYVFSLPHSIIAVSIAIAFFTSMSNHAADKNIQGIRDDLSNALRAVGMLTTISAFVLAVVAVPFSRIYEADFEHMLQMAIIIWAMLFCLVGFSAEYVIQRVFFALDDTRTAFLYTLFGMLVTFALLWYTSTLPGLWIIAGAAASVSIANLVSVTAWLFLVHRKIGSYGFRLIFKRHVQYLVYAIAAAIPGGAIVWLLGGYRADSFGTTNTVGALTTCVAAGAVMAIVYFGLLWLTRNPDFRSTMGILASKVRRRSPSEAA